MSHSNMFLAVLRLFGKSIGKANLVKETSLRICLYDDSFLLLTHQQHEAISCTAPDDPASCRPYLFLIASILRKKIATE